VFAWGGGALFLVSLAFFLYTYLVTFSRPAAAAPPAAIALNVGLFTLFALHHSVFARERVRVLIARSVRPGLERSVYVWVASLLFIAVCALWQPIGGVFWRVDGSARVLLWILQAFGGWLTLWSAGVIDIRDLAGLPPSKAGRAGGAGDTNEVNQASNHAVSRSAQTLSTSLTSPTRPIEFKKVGPYGWVRHPIYSGWLLLVFACSPMTGTRFLFATVSSAYLLIAIPLEERSLRVTTNGAYERYMKQVRWKLVPGVY
jgi:methanethiol S-methyltransferase